MYHRAAVVMETFTMFYNRGEKEVGMEWITGRKNNKKQNFRISVRENSLLKMQRKSGILFT